MCTKPKTLQSQTPFPEHFASCMVQYLIWTAWWSKLKSPLLVRHSVVIYTHSNDGSIYIHMQQNNDGVAAVYQQHMCIYCMYLPFRVHILKQSFVPLCTCYDMEHNMDVSNMFNRDALKQLFSTVVALKWQRLIENMHMYKYVCYKHTVHGV